MRKKNNPFLFAIALVLIFMTSALFVFNNTNVSDDNEVASTAETDTGSQDLASELPSDTVEVAAMNPDEYDTGESVSGYAGEDKGFSPSEYDDYADGSDSQLNGRKDEASYSESHNNNPVEPADRLYDGYNTQPKELVSSASPSAHYNEKQKPVSESTTPFTNNRVNSNTESSNASKNKSSENAEIESVEAEQSYPNYAKAENSPEASLDSIQQDDEDPADDIQQDSYDSTDTSRQYDEDITKEAQLDVENTAEDVEQEENDSADLQYEDEDTTNESDAYENPDNTEADDDEALDDSEADDYEAMVDSDSDNTTDSADSPAVPQQLDAEQIITILSESVISDSGTFASYIDRDDWERRTIGSFGEQHTNCFSVNTGARYNMWGGGTQFVSFNIKELNDYQFLNFTICGENGTDGEMNVDVYVDREMEGDPDYNYHFNSCTIPAEAKINIQGASFIGILVNNLSGNENRMVFYNLSVSDV